MLRTWRHRGSVPDLALGSWGPSRLHPSYRWVEVSVASHRYAPGSEVGRSGGFSYRLARLFPLSRRGSHQAASPKPDHLLCTFRHDGRRLALCFRSRSAPGRPDYSIGSAQPHAHQRVFLEPGISHLLSFPARIRSRLTTHPSPGRGRACIHPDNPPCPLLRRLLPWRRHTARAIDNGLVGGSARRFEPQ